MSDKLPRAMIRGHSLVQRWSACHLLVALLVSAFPALAADDSDRLVSAFLYQISKFVSWPPQSFSDESANSPLNICYVGAISETLASSASELVNKRSQDRMIQSHLLRDMASFDAYYARLGRCQLALLDVGMAPHFATLIAKDSGMLTVGRSTEFLDAGGSLAIINENNRMVIYMNPVALERSPVKLESRLLNLVKPR